jgi:transposase
MSAPVTHLGIDIAARSLALARLHGDAHPVDLPALANDPDGWHHLIAALHDHGDTPATTRIVMEATGAYWQGLATALHTAGWVVSVVSPGSARAYARARTRRAKTDAIDARLLAEYGRDLHPEAWTPPPAEVTALQLLVRQRDDLVAMRTQTRNRQHALAQLPALPPEVQEPLGAVLRVVEEQIAALDRAIRQRAAATVAVAAPIARLQTIVGVGLLTAVVVVTETRPLWGSANAAEIVAYAGLDPAPQRSGSSVRGAGHISKTGNARLRRAVYMAAVTAARCNPVFQPFYERLVARGKAKKVALVAVARKVLALMVTLLIHERDFDPLWEARRRASR